MGQLIPLTPARRSPTPAWHPAMKVVRHEPATFATQRERELADGGWRHVITVDLPVELGTFNDLLRVLRARYGQVEVIGHGTHEHWWIPDVEGGDRG